METNLTMLHARDQLSYTSGGSSAVVLKPQTTDSPHMVHDKKNLSDTQFKEMY